MNPNPNDNSVLSRPGAEILAAAVRRLPSRVLGTIQACDGWRHGPRLCRYRNGRGCEYERLRVTTRTRRRSAFHIGRLTAEEIVSLDQVLAARWPESREARLIQRLRGYKQHVIRLIVALAPQCGVHFHGHEMRRKRDK